MHGIEMSSPRSMHRLHMQRQSWKDRMRGWAFVVRRRGALDTVRHVWRWLHLLRLASPRYCVYAAALAYWSNLEMAVPRVECPVSSGTPEQTPKDLIAEFEILNLKLGTTFETTRNWLPISSPFADPAVSTSDLAKAILWNYQEFLVETTA